MNPLLLVLYIFNIPVNIPGAGYAGITFSKKTGAKRKGETGNFPAY
jgi:hypothetical protein